MISEYNAFISYRHAPRDIAVAEELQKRLERFPIPKDIQTTCGIRRIERIFRDKSELPISSNLGNDIEQALLHSQYLIVICSPRTKESLWIQREIDLFLEHHDHDHVLTVICEGEPSEVIPKQLCSCKKTIVNPDGTETEVMETLEPLSCDYRGSFREAGKTELPRLVAVLIGCSYDELVRRRQQYLRKRYLTIGGIIFSALAIFIGYLIWSRAQIQNNWQIAEKNLNQSRINQSRFLAESALEALDNQDRLLAIALAEKAMPSEGNERPLTAEAMYALSLSLGIYQNRDASKFSAIRQYETDAVITEMAVSPDQKYLACMDRNDDFYLWQLSDGTLITRKRMRGYSLMGDGLESIVLLSSGHVTALSWQAGEVLWDLDFPSTSSELRITPAPANGIITRRDMEGFSWFSADGSVRGRIEFSQLPQEGSDYYIFAQAFPEANLLALIRMHFREDDSASEKLILYDLSSGEYQTAAQDFQTISCVRMLENGTLLIADTRNMSERGTITVDDLTMYKKMEYALTALDLKRAEVLWTSPLSCLQSQDHRLDTHVSEDGSQWITVSLSNMQYVLDASDGKLLNSAEFPAPVIRVLSIEDDRIYSILRDGQVGIMIFNDPDIVSASSPLLISDLENVGKAYAGEEKYLLALPFRQSRIIQYSPEIPIPDRETLAEIGTEDLSLIAWNEDDLLALVNTDYTRCRVRIFDLSSDQWAIDQDVQGTMIDSAFQSDGSFAVITGSEKITSLTMIHPKAQRAETRILSSSWDRNFALCSASGQDMLYSVFNHAESAFISADGKAHGTLEFTAENLLSGEIKTVTYPYDGTLFVHDLFPSKDPDFLLMTYEKESQTADTELLGIRFQDLTCAKLGTAFEDSDVRPSFQSSKFSLLTNDGIAVYDPDRSLSDPVLVIPCNERTILSCAYHDNDLFVLQNDGVISRYDENGILRKQYAGDEIEGRTAAMDTIAWMFYGNELALCSSGNIQHYDLSESMRDFSAENAILYDRKRNRMILRQNDSGHYSLGVQRIYSPTELVELARKETGSSPLSEQMKRRYGIE